MTLPGTPPTFSSDPIGVAARRAADLDAATGGVDAAVVDLERIRRGELSDEKPDGWPDRCGICGAPWSEIGFDVADGFNCRKCGASDADE